LDVRIRFSFSFPPSLAELISHFWPQDISKVK
jgi:hypothetical protein